MMFFGVFKNPLLVFGLGEIVQNHKNNTKYLGKQVTSKI